MKIMLIKNNKINNKIINKLTKSLFNNKLLKYLMILQLKIQKNKCLIYNRSSALKLMSVIKADWQITNNCMSNYQI